MTVNIGSVFMTVIVLLNSDAFGGLLILFLFRMCINYFPLSEVLVLQIPFNNIIL